MMNLEGKIALVTGSTSGIGRAIAIHLAAAGASVLVTGRREEEGAETVALIEAGKGDAAFFCADISDDKSVAGLVEFAVSRFGGLDVLVNNAGMVPRNPDGSMADGPLHLTDPDYWEKIWRVDLRSVLMISRSAIPHLLESEKSPSIINIASVHGAHGCGLDVYSAMKGGVIALTRSMAVSYAPRLRVNSISPGMVVVERTAEMIETHPEIHEQFEKSYLTRMGRPDDVAAFCVLLASEAGEYITGADIALDGGMSIKGAFPPSPEYALGRFNVAGRS